MRSAIELSRPLGWTDYLAGPAGDGAVDFKGNPASPVWTFESHTEYMLSLYGEIDSSSGDATVYHGDMIGSTMLTSRLEDDPPGQESVEAVSAVAYTAFGETVTLTAAVDPNGVPDPNDANEPNSAPEVIWTASIGGALPEGFPRYAYAGQHGYESGLLSRTGANPNLPPVTLQHLGWRWYDPSLGRFVQRDPIGIAGGMNVYAYVQASPLHRVDPTGTQLRLPGGKAVYDESELPYLCTKFPPPSSRDLTPEQELIKVKKWYYVKKTVVTAGSTLLGCFLAGPFGAVAGAAAGLGVDVVVDEVIHYDEPENPVSGGLDDWHTYYIK